MIFIISGAYTNKKAGKTFRSSSFILVGGAYETRTRDPMRDRHVF